VEHRWLAACLVLDCSLTTQLPHTESTLPALMHLECWVDERTMSSHPQGAGILSDDLYSK
jgi:hypothetical protein